MSRDTRVILGFPDGQHIGFLVPAQWDRDDEWLDVEISLRVTGFSADFSAHLARFDLAALRDALAQHAKGRPTGEGWEAHEGSLLLRIGVDEVEGVATESPLGNRLHFSMPFSHRWIDAAIDQLDLLLVEYG